jgi:hypothetical protein
MQCHPWKNEKSFGIILWHVDPLLGNNRERISYYNSHYGFKFKTAPEERCFLCGPCREVISKIEGRLVQLEAVS